MTFADIVNNIINLVLNPLVALSIGVALLLFMWGIVKYVTAGGDSGKRGEGATMMTYGVIALFVMVAVWGLVNVVANTIGVGSGGVPNVIP